MLSSLLLKKFLGAQRIRNLSSHGGKCFPSLLTLCNRVHSNQFYSWTTSSSWWMCPLLLAFMECLDCWEEEQEDRTDCKAFSCCSHIWCPLIQPSSPANNNNNTFFYNIFCNSFFFYNSFFFFCNTFLIYNSFFFFCNTFLLYNSIIFFCNTFLFYNIIIIFLFF